MGMREMGSGGTQLPALSLLRSHPVLMPPTLEGHTDRSSDLALLLALLRRRLSFW